MAIMSDRNGNETCRPTRDGLEDQCGMSLFELIVVIVIIGAVSIVAVPQLTDARENYRLTAVAQQVSGNLSNPRILSITENSDYRVRIAGTDSYVVEEEVVGVWTNRSTYGMPVGFTISTTGAIVEFHYRGNATPTDTFTLTNPDNNTRDVVTTTSGRTYVQ